MLPPFKKLSTQITGILLIFFLVALGAIGMTLALSWQLEGGSAAINDAGSERMRAYRLSHLMSLGLEAGADRLRIDAALREEIALFDKLLADIGQGDPARPLAPPRSAEVKRRLDALRNDWQRRMLPLIQDYLAGEGAEPRRAALLRYRAEVEGFVAGINDLVLAMEQNYAYGTNLLRTYQLVLVLLAVCGTGLLIRFFFRLVIRPVGVLHDGLRRMAGDDLGVRLPADRKDEFGMLARGFNRMAEHLQEVHSTLEERVATKTRSLAERNDELGLLYETTAFLNDPAPLEPLCEGFIGRVVAATRADAGAVRLYSPGTEELIMTSHLGLSEQFVAKETALRCGDCLCSDVMHGGDAVAFEVARPPAPLRLNSCVREGFGTASVFTITHNKRRLGIFNLYFNAPRPLGEREKIMLETLGQHLGAAVENLRLRSREREMAVSEERNLLAQELHDSIAQGLAFINIQAQLLEDSLRRNDVPEAGATLDSLKEGIQESYDHVRELLVHFRTRMQEIELEAAIADTLSKFESQTGIATAFEKSGSSLPMPAEEQIQVVHIVQESLSNIRKHARATRVAVKVERSMQGVSIQVEDDGVGFDPQSSPALHSDRHVGLKIMNERARRVGGQCEIESATGKGTRVSLWLPRQKMEVA